MEIENVFLENEKLEDFLPIIKSLNRPIVNLQVKLIIRDLLKDILAPTELLPILP